MSTSFFRCSECGQEWTSEACFNPECLGGQINRLVVSTRHPPAIHGECLPDEWEPPHDFFRHALCGGSLIFSGPFGCADHARCDTCGARWRFEHRRWRGKLPLELSLWVRESEPPHPPFSPGGEAGRPDSEPPA